MKTCGVVGVICGGDSPERDVSLVSGRQVYKALEELKAQVMLLEIESLVDLTPELPKIDVAFICLHGGSGEDGTLQHVLDQNEIPYAGSGPAASALAMNKVRSKAVLAKAGLPVPKARRYQGEPIPEFCEAVLNELDLPVVLKPCNQGSSLGVQKVEGKSDLLSAAAEILDHYGSFFAEEFICGRELTVPILLRDGKEEPLPIIEVRYETSLLSYEAKYTKGLSEMRVPALLGEKPTQVVQEVCLSAHRVLGCFGFSRVDVMLDNKNTPYILEINTLPGMTPMSAFAESAAVVGMSFCNLTWSRQCYKRHSKKPKDGERRDAPAEGT